MLQLLKKAPSSKIFTISTKRIFLFPIQPTKTYSIESMPPTHMELVILPSSKPLVDIQENKSGSPQNASFFQEDLTPLGLISGRIAALQKFLDGDVNTKKDVYYKAISEIGTQ